MLVKLTKLTFYQFQPNKELFFYYATTDTLTFRGIATPELAEALVAFLENDESFECKIEERPDGSLKLTQLLSEPRESFPRIFARWDDKEHTNQRKVVIQPKQITLFRRNNKLKAVLKHKSEDGSECSIFGDVDKSWAVWYLLMLRQAEEFSLAIDNKMTFKTNCKLFNEDEVFKYYKRSESTYIDNPKNFFCANESPSLKRPVYKKNVEPTNE